ncbi:arsenate reductase/protein-tyrosine-phosphatase family protein [Actibacterium sp. D379-3]
MISSVLVVCVGNICRSPAGERVLRNLLPQLRVESAGLGALVGHPADPVMSEVAAAHGISLDGHVARQFSAKLATDFDLILVMEQGHRADVIRTAPHLSGKTLLFDQWSGGKGIADPYQRRREFHQRIFDEITQAAQTWATKLDR